MADQEIKTSIDGLITYLNEHGETNTTMIASALGVGESTIIEWSNILEKANMIRIVHKSGRMFLSPLKGLGGTSIDIKAEEDSDQMRVQAEVASQIAVVNQISAKIEQFNRSISAIDDLFKTRYKSAKPYLDRVNAIQNRIDGFEKRISSKSKQIEELETKMRREFDALQRYSEGLSGFSVDTNNARAVSDEIKGRMNSYEASAEEMSKNFEQTVHKYRKEMQETYREVKEKSDQLKQIVELEDRQIKEYERTAKDYKRDSELIIRRAEQRKKSAIDEIEKTRQEVARLSSVADKDLGSLKAAVNDLKAGLGSIASLNDNLSSIKKELGDATTQKNAILRDLGAMEQDVKAVKEIKKPAEKLAKASNLKERNEQITAKVKDLKNSADKIGQQFKVLGGEDKNKGAQTNADTTSSSKSGDAKAADAGNNNPADNNK